jgi:hypothetical protein
LHSRVVLVGLRAQLRKPSTAGSPGDRFAHQEELACTVTMASTNVRLAAMAWLVATAIIWQPVTSAPTVAGGGTSGWSTCGANAHPVIENGELRGCRCIRDYQPVNITAIAAMERNEGDVGSSGPSGGRVRAGTGSHNIICNVDVLSKDPHLPTHCVCLPSVVVRKHFVVQATQADTKPAGAGSSTKINNGVVASACAAFDCRCDEFTNPAMKDKIRQFAAGGFPPEFAGADAWAASHCREPGEQRPTGPGQRDLRVLPEEVSATMVDESIGKCTGDHGIACERAAVRCTRAAVQQALDAYAEVGSAINDAAANGAPARDEDAVVSLSSLPSSSSSSSSSLSAIPRRLFFVWLGPSPTMPLLLADNILATIEAFRTEWSNGNGGGDGDDERGGGDAPARIVRDDECLRAVREYGEDKLVVLWDLLKKTSQDMSGRADLCRAVILYNEGGYYADADMITLRPVVPAPSITLVVATCEYEDPHNCIQNTFIAVTPRHPVIKAQLELMAALVQGGQLTIDIDHPDRDGKHKIFGPWTLAKVLPEWREQHGAQQLMLLEEEQAVRGRLSKNPRVESALTHFNPQEHLCNIFLFDPKNPDVA